MKVVAVIPARGGSKGVPGKNLRQVAGIPLVTRAATSAQLARSIDQVYVSTDDEEIARKARAAGALVIERPAEIAGDTASSEAALLHALDEIDADILVFLQATSPFIDPTDLDAAVARVVDGTDDVVLSATESHGFLWRVGDSGAEGINHEAAVRLRRQDTEPQYLETGAFYVMRAAGFRAAGHRFFGRVGLAIVSPLGALEIDSFDDLDLARAIAPLVTASPSRTATPPVSSTTQEESWSPSARTM